MRTLIANVALLCAASVAGTADITQHTSATEAASAGMVEVAFGGLAVPHLWVLDPNLEAVHALGHDVFLTLTIKKIHTEERRHGEGLLHMASLPLPSASSMRSQSRLAMGFADSRRRSDSDLYSSVPPLLRVIFLSHQG